MMYPFQQHVSQYLRRARPQMWQEMSDQDKAQIGHRINEEMHALMMNPPWPRPTSQEYLDQLHWNQQVQAWAQETALHHHLYQQWPIDQDNSEGEDNEMVVEMMELQAEIRQDVQHALENLERPRS